MEQAQLEIQKILNKSLVELQVKNPHISLRGFATRINLSPSAVSEILNGKRRVSKKMAGKIADNLSLDPVEKNDLLKLFNGHLPEESSQVEDKNPRNVTYLDADSFKSISEWYHFAILSLAETRDFKGEPYWIADRLNISEAQAEQALERLLRLGMFKKSRNGKLVFSKAKYRTTDEVVNVALRKAHSVNLELAQRSLQKDPIDKRDFNAMTMSINMKKLPKAKELIRKFKEDMCDVLETGHKSEVYKLCIQLFPLTDIDQK